MIASAGAALVAGAGLGLVLANDYPLAGVPPPALAAITVLLAVPTALAGTWLLLSLEPVGRFGFWRGVFSTLLAWFAFCVALAITVQLLQVPPGWIYGGGVFAFGSIFILPFLLLFGGAIGWLAGRHWTT